MPYIKQNMRTGFVKAHIDEIVEYVADLDPTDVDGFLNYYFTSILKRTYYDRYYSLNAAIGLLECVKLELYRRVVAPYEDKKIEENGDVA